ncbi:MAG: hypothetical protein JWQ39_2177 [Glaciihabitans sp.]|nr:hypothetical protein [Glaciihabitans sp.]
MKMSLPEKTFEHWVSMYISHRFSTHVQQWWPSAGADVALNGGVPMTGKAFWLELKTAQPTGTAHEHTVTIDLKQLDAYLHPKKGVLWAPVYYVFPLPMWDGVLGESSSLKWLAGDSPTELAFRRVDRPHPSKRHWFGQWTMVLPGWQLHSLFRREIASGQATVTLMRVASRTLTWHRRVGAPLAPLALPQFFDLMRNCGDREHPATFFLSSQMAPVANSRGYVSRQTLSDAVRQDNGERGVDLRVFRPTFADDQLTGLYSSAGGDFVPTYPARADVVDSQDAGDSYAGDQGDDSGVAPLGGRVLINMSSGALT